MFPVKEVPLTLSTDLLGKKGIKKRDVNPGEKRIMNGWRQFRSDKRKEREEWVNFGHPDLRER